MIAYTVASICLMDRKLLTNKVESNVDLSSQLSDQLLQQAKKQGLTK